MEAGYFLSIPGGRIGRATRLPPQPGQTPSKRSSAHVEQNVHSNVQIIASGDSGGRSRSQASQFGRSFSMLRLLYFELFGQRKRVAVRVFEPRDSDEAGNLTDAKPRSALFE